MLMMKPHFAFFAVVYLFFRTTPVSVQIIGEGPCPNVTCMRSTDLENFTRTLIERARAAPPGASNCEAYATITDTGNGEYLVHAVAVNKTDGVYERFVTLVPATESDRTFNGNFNDSTTSFKFCVVLNNNRSLNTYSCEPINATHTSSSAVIRLKGFFFHVGELQSLKLDYLSKGASPDVVDAINVRNASACEDYHDVFINDTPIFV